MTQGGEVIPSAGAASRHVSVFSNCGLLGLKELDTSPCLSSRLTDVDNGTSIAKKKAVSLVQTVIRGKKVCI